MPASAIRRSRSAGPNAATTAGSKPRNAAWNVSRLLRIVDHDRPAWKASGAAAEADTRYAALVCFSYPLHPPGRPERTEARIAHWTRIECPVLILSGEADPFARIELLRAAMPLLRNAELVTYPKLGHGL